MIRSLLLMEHGRCSENLSVEKDFIENFMLTDPDEMEHAFFPEVYPGSKKIPVIPELKTGRSG